MSVTTAWRAPLAHALAKVGKRTEAETILGHLVRQAESRYIDPFWFALIHSGLDQRDRAIDYMEQAAEDRTVNAFIAYPGLDSIRSDPRFGRLMARMGLPSVR